MSVVRIEGLFGKKLKYRYDFVWNNVVVCYVCTVCKGWTYTDWRVKTVAGGSKDTYRVRLELVFIWSCMYRLWLELR